MRCAQSHSGGWPTHDIEREGTPLTPCRTLDRCSNRNAFRVRFWAPYDACLDRGRCDRGAPFFFFAGSSSWESLRPLPKRDLNKNTTATWWKKTNPHGLGTPRESRAKKQKKTYFRRFWFQKARHSETGSGEKHYLYRITRDTVTHTHGYPIHAV